MNPEGDRISFVGIDKNSESELALLGLDDEIAKRSGLIPNSECFENTRRTAAPDDDLIARRTPHFQL